MFNKIVLTRKGRRTVTRNNNNFITLYRRSFRHHRTPANLYQELQQKKQKFESQLHKKVQPHWNILKHKYDPSNTISLQQVQQKQLEDQQKAIQDLEEQELIKIQEEEERANRREQRERSRGNNREIQNQNQQSYNNQRNNNYQQQNQGQYHEQQQRQQQGHYQNDHQQKIKKYNDMVIEVSKTGNLTEISSVFNQMNSDGVRAVSHNLTTVLTEIRNMGNSKLLIDAWNLKSTWGTTPNLACFSNYFRALSRLKANASDIISAWIEFKNTNFKVDVIIINIVLDAYYRQRQYPEINEICTKIKMRQYPADQFSFSIVLRTAVRSGKIDDVFEVYTTILKAGISPEVHFISHAIQGFRFQSDNDIILFWEKFQPTIDKKYKFSPIEDFVVNSCNNRLGVLASNNEFSAMKNFFAKMKEKNIPPTAHTFFIIFDNLSRAGRDGDIMAFWVQMIDYQIIPSNQSIDRVLNGLVHKRNLLAVDDVLAFVEKRGIIVEENTKKEIEVLRLKKGQKEGQKEGQQQQQQQGQQGQ